MALVNPFRKFLQGAARVFRVRMILERVISNQLATLESLQKRIVQIARKARPFSNSFIKSNSN